MADVPFFLISTSDPRLAVYVCIGLCLGSCRTMQLRLVLLEYHDPEQISDIVCVIFVKFFCEKRE